MAEAAAGFAIVHAEDCIAATAALRIREAGARWRVLRTVHHVDDFTTPALIECQQRSIEGPDACLVVSAHWRDRLRQEYGIHAAVVRNGVDVERFDSVPPHLARAFRDRIGARDRFVFLTVGGIEPRKGSLELFEALAAGLPVVTTALPVFHEFLVPGRDALMVLAGDAAALAGAMSRLVREPALRSSLPAAGPPVA